MKNLINKIPFEIPEMAEKMKYYLLAGLVVFILFFDYVLFMRFQINALKSISPKNIELSENLKELKRNLENMPHYQKEVSRLREKLVRVDASVLSREEIPMMLEKISRLAIAAGVQIDQIMPLKDSQELVLEREGAKYFALPIYVKGQGGYHAIGELFSRIEGDQIFMNIEDFDIMQNSAHLRNHIFKIAITIFIVEKD
ncbi:MAG: type 4a pilus biogenesis protein PilO [Candidatus Omnitrophica bacterium]|nr:type 4a pilus biogenesis protein PilO [Candidatus Omnitrophota bacterium]